MSARDWLMVGLIGTGFGLLVGVPIIMWLSGVWMPGLLALSIALLIAAGVVAALPARSNKQPNIYVVRAWTDEYWWMYVVRADSPEAAAKMVTCRHPGTNVHATMMNFDASWRPNAAILIAQDDEMYV